MLLFNGGQPVEQDSVRKLPAQVDEQCNPTTHTDELRIIITCNNYMRVQKLRECNSMYLQRICISLCKNLLNPCGLLSAGMKCLSERKELLYMSRHAVNLSETVVTTHCPCLHNIRTITGYRLLVTQ